MSVHLDEIDRAIIGELRVDARQSVNAVADRVRISRANAYARIKKMTDGGLILGYGLRTDPVEEGFHSSAYAALTVDQSRWQDIRAALIASESVEHIALLGGEYDVLVLVRARDNRELRRVVLEEIQSIPGVRSSRTYLIFEDVDAHVARSVGD